MQLRSKCCLLPLTALDADPGKESTVTLKDVYISLNTTAVKEESTDESTKKAEDALFIQRIDEPLTAKEAIERAPHVVLLGKPGSGKSTFVNQVIVSYIDTLLEEQEATQADPTPELMPVKIVLRDLAQRLATAGLPANLHTQNQRSLARLLLDQAVHDLADLDAEEFKGEIVEAFRNRQCLLVLDGLDEVPIPLRVAIRDVVRAVQSLYEPSRLIVTCRIRSYEDESGKIPLLTTYTLAPFNNKQKRQFAQAWYRTPANRERFTQKEAKAHADLLAKAATQGALSELATNPMLLTTMAIIHQRDIGLPEERVKLYKLAVDVLVRRWQRAKAPHGGKDANDELDDFLKDDRRLRRTLTRLAYEAHRSKEEGQEAADLARKDAVFILEAEEYLGSLGLAEDFLEYVDHRSGLLVGQGGGVEAKSKPVSYSFPHRTFQEYLAGCYLVDLPDPSGALITHAAEGSYWYEAVQLALEELLHNRGRDWELINLAYPLSPQTYPESVERQRLILWAGFIATLVGTDLITSDVRYPDQGLAFTQRLKKQLVRLLGGALPSIERAEAGRILARLTDPRGALMTIEEMTFCYVPAGPFLMGADREEVDLPYSYWIGRYPVTQAQYRYFVAAEGYKDRRWWTEAGWEYIQGLRARSSLRVGRGDQYV